SEGQYRGSAILVTQGDPSGDNLAVDLVGWGGGPKISCTPLALDFGDLQLGQIATAPVLCTNVGTAASLANLLLQPPSVSPQAFTAHFDQSLDPYPVDGLAPDKSAQI